MIQEEFRHLGGFPVPDEESRDPLERQSVIIGGELRPWKAEGRMSWPAPAPSFPMTKLTWAKPLQVSSKEFRNGASAAHLVGCDSSPRR